MEASGFGTLISYDGSCVLLAEQADDEIVFPPER